MASSNNTLIDYDNVLLKLGVKHPKDGSIYRNIPISCLDLIDLNGSSAIKTLQKFAILLSREDINQNNYE